MPIALITGITGQDGSYLAELLVGKGYRVVGMTRRSSTGAMERIEHLLDRIELVQGDVLDQASFDMVIASMALPGMSGLDLLRATMVRQPHTVRVLLLDRPQPEFMLNAVGIVHQYLVKPCAGGDLLATVCRLLALDQFFTSDPLRRVVARIQQLPSPPTIYFRLMQELARPDATTGSIGEIIAQDASLTAKLLQLANSAFFSVPQPVVSVPEAVQIIGFNLVRSLSLSLGLFASLNGEAVGEYNSERLYLHSLATGLLAQRILSDEGAESAIVDAAFTVKPWAGVEVEAV